MEVGVARGVKRPGAEGGERQGWERGLEGGSAAGKRMKAGDGETSEGVKESCDGQGSYDIGEIVKIRTNDAGVVTNRTDCVSQKRGKDCDKEGKRERVPLPKMNKKLAQKVNNIT